MLQIFATSKQLAKSTNYARIARPKASKATKVHGQHKKQNFDANLLGTIDRQNVNIGGRIVNKMAIKQARQKAALKYQLSKTKK